MTIAIVSDFSLESTGGVQSSIQAQITELRRQGHRVIVISPADNNQAKTTSDSIEVPSFRYIRPNDHATPNPFRYTVRDIVQRLAKENIDVVHSQTTGILGAQSRIIADGLGVPLIQTMHGRDDMFIAKTSRTPLLAAVGVWLLDMLMNRSVRGLSSQEPTLVGRLVWSTMLGRAERADMVTVPSRHFRQKFIERGTPADKIKVVSNGLDDAILDTLPANHSRDRQDIQKLLWCGRLSAEKDPMIAIEAVADLSGASLEIYGTGPMMNKCQEYIDQLNLGNTITLHGSYSHEDVYGLMTRHDVLLYTSYDFDNQPMVLLEAAAVGLPVVFCDPDMSECVAPNGGIQSAEHTADSLATAIKSIRRSSLQPMQAAQRDFAELHRQSVATRAMVEVYGRAIDASEREA